MHAGGAYHHATWTGISGDRFHGRFTGADFSLVDNPGSMSTFAAEANSINAWCMAPRVSKPETMHIILAVTDRGMPALTRYQRVVVTIQP
jgi:hypothetical protein